MTHPDQYTRRADPLEGAKVCGYCGRLIGEGATIVRGAGQGAWEHLRCYPTPRPNPCPHGRNRYACLVCVGVLAETHPADTPFIPPGQPVPTP
jgi:hypothetical protein